LLEIWGLIDDHGQRGSNLNLIFPTYYTKIRSSWLTLRSKEKIHSEQFKKNETIEDETRREHQPNHQHPIIPFKCPENDNGFDKNEDHRPTSKSNNFESWVRNTRVALVSNEPGQ
jgi:hypothetical protein